MKTFLSKFIKHLINLLDVCERRIECIIFIESAIEGLLYKYFNNKYVAKCKMISIISMMSDALKESKDSESIKMEFEDL